MQSAGHAADSSTMSTPLSMAAGCRWRSYSPSASAMTELFLPVSSTPQTRPAAVVGDKACSSGKTRRRLTARGVKAVVPQKSDEIAARQRKGPCGGRPPGFDKTAYADRNVIERRFGLAKQWRGKGHSLRQAHHHLQSQRRPLRSHRLATKIDDTAYPSPRANNPGYMMTRPSSSTVMDRRKSESRDS